MTKRKRPPCPACQVGRVVKNGFGSNGVQRWRCRGCGRQFVHHPEGSLRVQKRIIAQRMFARGFTPIDVVEVLEVSPSWAYKLRFGFGDEE